MYTIISNQDIDDELLDKLAGLETLIFRENSIGTEIFKANHKERKGGLFCILDDEKPIGFVDAIFLSDEQTEQCLIDRDFRKLVNIGATIGSGNNLYLCSLVLLEEYRCSGIIKMFVHSFAKWISELKRNNVQFKFVFSDAISLEGAKASAKLMGMIPVDKAKIDEHGFGLYYSPDKLESFIARATAKQ